MNYVLIGLKNKHAHGSFHGAEGFEGFSMDGTEVSVIKEGTMGELQAYVNTQRKLAKDATEKLNYLEDRLNREDETLSEEEYDTKSDEYIRQRAILKYDKLLILQGMIL